MGSTSTYLLPTAPSSLYNHTLNPTKPLIFRTKYPCSLFSRPNWASNSGSFRAGRFEFDDDFGFGRREKRRNWWSDDDDDDDDDDDVEFGFWEEPDAIDWIFKILRAFGWMVPVVLISTLLGTGPNSVLMALVLPLGQTALSLVMDTFWGGPSSSPNPRPRSRRRPRPRPRSKRNPFARTANETQVNEAQEPRTKARSMRGSYQSWGPANSGSAKRGGKSESRFGGWDELDKQAGSSMNFSSEEQNRNADELPKQNSGTGKLSRRRNRDKPLLIRLLIAVFPFLGSWTRFLF